MRAARQVRVRLSCFGVVEGKASSGACIGNSKFSCCCGDTVVLDCCVAELGRPPGTCSVLYSVFISVRPKGNSSRVRSLHHSFAKLIQQTGYNQYLRADMEHSTGRPGVSRSMAKSGISAVQPWKVHDMKAKKAGIRKTMHMVKPAARMGPPSGRVKRGGEKLGMVTAFSGAGSYEGAWLGNKKHGFGTMVYSDGRKVS